MTLAQYLADKQNRGTLSADAAHSIAKLSLAAITLTNLIRRTGMNPDVSAATQANPSGDTQKKLDVLAHDIIAECLADSGAAFLLSEEIATPHPLNKTGAGEIIVAVDPLDGSSNSDVNIPTGTIFSLMPYADKTQPPAPCIGRQQLAAGFFVYGPQTVLLVAVADDSPPQGFVLDETISQTQTPPSQQFLALQEAATIPPTTSEFAINAAYAQYWHPPMQTWMTETQHGRHGPRGKDYRMRWVGSLVADAWRIFCRGGVFLYPADKRASHSSGRLRLVYEANPMAFLAEKAGGAASTGAMPILDVPPKTIHQTTPLFFGAREEIAHLVNLHTKHTHD